MDLSFASLIEWSKLTLRDPRMASLMAKAANLPLQASILVIVITGVVSGIFSAVLGLLIPPPPADALQETSALLTIEDLGPLAIAALTIFGNLALVFFIHRIGRRMGGTGALADIAAVTAVLQIVMTVILVVQVAVRLVLPILYFAVVMLGIYVFLRGLGHAVNVGHDFDDLGKSALIILLSFLASVIIASVFVAVLGIGPPLAIEGSGL